VTGTPTESRRPSVTPSISTTPTVVSEDEQQHEDEEEHGDEEDVEDPLSSSALDTMVAPSISRRASVVEPTPPATKQRRLSTLSNTQRSGDVFRKNSFSQEPPSKGQVIGIPFPPTSAAAKRRRSSVAPGPKALAAKRRSISIESPTTLALPTPPPTQDGSVHYEMTKSQAKQPEETIEEVNEQEETKAEIKYDENGDLKVDMQEGIIVVKRDGDGVEILKKVLYDPMDPDQVKNVITQDHRITAFGQISKSIYSLSPDVAARLSIDEEKFTMEDLCKPSLPIGKASTHFEMAQQARKNRLQERAKKRMIRSKARLEKRSIASFEEDVKDISSIKRESMLPDEEDEGPANVAIQLKLKDGQLIVDEESTVVDRHKNTSHANRERQDENPFENVVNSATYGRQRYTDKWDSQEVAKFYKALGQWGTDFALIAQMFPHRTRKQVKSKFILEEKRRPRLVELALSNKLGAEFDFEAYCADSNKTFATLNEFNAKLGKLKEEHEENLKELSVAKEKAKEEDLQKQKKREHEIQTGQRVMTRQERLTELTKHETVLGSIDDIKKQRQEETASAT
jgi:transcription factor TFIIIB component B''